LGQNSRAFTSRFGLLSLCTVEEAIIGGVLFGQVAGENLKHRHPHGDAHFHLFADRTA
jgi:hypothetical protein